MLYALLRPLFFALEPEAAHLAAFRQLEWLHRAKLGRLLTPRVTTDPVNVMGLTFTNPVGLAAGLDKNAEHIDALFDCGFGFMEVGTVTPRSQPGNPKPRLFRLPRAHALINRFGFNNEGIDRFVERVRGSRAWQASDRVIGLNLGKNADTPIERALDDYVACLRKVYPVLAGRAGYVAINISSPNTANLRTLQQKSEFGRLLSGVRDERARLSDRFGARVPMAVKIAPDLANEDVHRIADGVVEHGMDAIIATNTTITRAGVHGLPHAEEAGGLSGAPLRARATEVVAVLHAHLRGALPIIGVGGILKGSDATEKLQAGATLVQLYTGLIYRGPALVGECRRAILKYRREATAAFGRAVSSSAG